MKIPPKSAIASLSLALLLGSVTSSSAAPLVSLGDNLNVFVTANVSGQYNSNILSAAGGPSKKDDYIVMLAPGVDIVYGGKQGPTTVTLTYFENFMFYMSNSNLNDNLSNVFLNADTKWDALTAGADFSYVQAYTNTPSAIGPGLPPLNTILRSDVINAGIDLNYTISPKFLAEAGFAYSQTEYLGTPGQAYQNQQSYTVPVRFYYVYSPKLDVGLYYTFQSVQPSSSPGNATTASIPGRSRTNNSGGFTARINSWEKVTGTIDIGIVNNDIESGPAGIPPSSSDTTFTYNMGLQYEFSDKLQFFLNGSRNFIAGSAGQNIEATNINFLVSYAYSSTISLNATVIGYTYSDYMQDPFGRKDNTYNSGFNVNWTPLSYLTVSAGYTYFMNSSNVNNATYNINLVTLSASLRY